MNCKFANLDYPSLKPTRDNPASRRSLTSAPGPSHGKAAAVTSNDTLRA